ncbi:F0F1 ATP synthase subunit A [Myxococcota bacterium]|nr:F0F1 ATP synthase subunit A [Myxococcota bacterium]
MTRVAWLALWMLVLSAGVARAEEGPGGAAAGHAASSEGHHWSWADAVVPADLRHRVQESLGNTWIEGTPVTQTGHLFFGGLAFLLILSLMGAAAWQMRSRPEDLLPRDRFSPLALFEVLSDALLSLMEQLMGREKALHFLPLIGSLGLFILFNNLLGLIPGFLPATSNLNTTFALGSVVFVATHYYGVRTHGLSYLKHFLGPIIKWYALPLMVLMFCIEMISHIARPVSLSIRLFGNMFGDHSALAAFLGVGVFGWILVPVIPLPLGMLVCVVQTLVFCILSVVYIQLATEHEEEEGSAHGA